MLIVVARMTACGDKDHMVNAVLISVNVFHIGNKRLTVSVQNSIQDTYLCMIIISSCNVPFTVVSLHMCVVY